MSTEPRELPTRERALEYLLSFDFLARPDLAEYVECHVDRFLATLAYLRPVARGAQVLELGAAPFAMSLLAMKHLGLALTPANFFGDYRERTAPSDEVTLRSARFAEEHVFRYQLFNLELDPFPYPAGSFDVVLCCEILEHLARDPSAMLGEIHRVLRDGGRLVLTTPNAKRLHNVYLALRGHNFYGPYSAFGVYGRHNREYTKWELHEILQAHNFRAQVDTEHAYRHGALHRVLTAVGFLRRRRDNLFALGIKHGATVRSYPPWLYEHLNERGSGASTASATQRATG